MIRKDSLPLLWRDMLYVIAPADILAVLFCVLAWLSIDDTRKAVLQGLAPITADDWKGIMTFGWVTTVTLCSVAAIIESYWPNKTDTGFIACIVPLIIMALGTLGMLVHTR